MVNGNAHSILLLPLNTFYMVRFSRLYAVIVSSLLFASCGINSEFMFQPPKDYVFDVPVIDSSSIDYLIQPNDVISFDLYTNEGSMMLEVSTSSVESQSSLRTTDVQYLVNSQGFVEFPVIGLQKVSGLTIAEAQQYIEDLYTPQFNRPYVQLSVLNRRAMVFLSPAGLGSVLELGKANVSVVEALAKSGGIGTYAKSDDIMLFRKLDNGQRLVYKIDLSTIQGIQFANMSVEAGDVIYVQTRRRIGQQLSMEVRSWLVVLSGIAVILTLQNAIR
jgi:polysaccharide export outer membrane protein